MSEKNGSNGTNGHHDESSAPAIQLEPFDYLAGNIKGRFEHVLTSRCVAFVGKNRRGKTARLEAFRLAFTGEHPVGPHGSNLMELAPENTLTLSVLARTGDPANPRQQTSYRVEVEGGKAKKDEKADRLGLLRDIEHLPNSDKVLESCLPIVAMRDLIKMGSTLGREAIFRRFGEITAIPTPRGLNTEQLTLWKEGLEASRTAKPKADTAEILAASSAWFRQRKLALGRDLKALEKLVKEREAKLGPAAAGSEELPQLKQRLEEAKAWEKSAELRAAKARIEQEAAAYRAKVQPMIDADKSEVRAAREADLVAQENAKKDAVTALVAVGTSITESIKTFSTEFDAAYRTKAEEYDAKVKKEVFYLTGGEWLTECIHILEGKVDADGNAACLLCGNSCHVATIKAAIEPRVLARRASVEKLYAERTQVLESLDSDKLTRIGVLEGKLADAKRAAEVADLEFRTWKSGIESARRAEEEEKNLLKQEYQRISGQMGQNAMALKSVPAAYEGPTAAELEAQIEALQNAETANRQLDAEVAKLRQLSLDQEVAKTLEQEAAKEVNTLLTRTAETANGAVNKYMPDGFRAALDLETAQWTVVGADNRPHNKKVMAGSEFGALLPALALAWTEGAPGRYLTLDDEDLAFFDPENLGLMLRALKDACDDGLLTQVFVAWSRPNEIPDDWQKIFVDGPALALVAPPASSSAPTEVLTDSGAPLLL